MKIYSICFYKLYQQTEGHIHKYGVGYRSFKNYFLIASY